jgi:hypothetical protein
MKKPSPKDELKWVCNEAHLQELMERYPEIWQSVGPQLISALEDGRAQTLKDYSAKAKSIEEMWHYKIRNSRNNLKVIESAMPHLAKSRMAMLALDKCYQAAATGKESGKIRFGLFNGYIVQKLLFNHNLTRKPASLKWFRLWWRFVSQKRILMPLVQPIGIYCNNKRHRSFMGTVGFGSGFVVAGRAGFWTGPCKACIKNAPGPGTALSLS